MIILRQRCYGDPGNESSGPGVGTVALGTLGAAAGTVALGRRGFLGAGMMKTINQGWAKTGKFLGNAEMMKSGTRGMAAADLWESGVGNRKLANALRKNSVGTTFGKEAAELNKTNKLVNKETQKVSYVNPQTNEVFKKTEGDNIKSIIGNNGRASIDWNNEDLLKKYGLNKGADIRNIIKNHRSATSVIQNEGGTEGFGAAIKNALNPGK